MEFLVFTKEDRRVIIFFVFIIFICTKGDNRNGKER